MARRTFSETSVLLILFDISGYTRFMIANSESRSHGYAVVTELMSCMVAGIRSPLVVSKLEGDAGFLYATLPEGPDNRRAVADRSVATIDGLFEAFSRKQRELSESNICPCGACVNLEQLSLKVIVHSGRAAIHPIGKFHELSGIDVIIAHRLLKNSVQRDRYVLMTVPASELLDPNREIEWSEAEEAYDEIGKVPVTVAMPPLSGSAATGVPDERRFGSLYWKAAHILKRIFVSRSMRLGLRRPGEFHNIPAGNE